MASRKDKHGPRGELWLYRDDYETDDYEPDIYNSAVLKPDADEKELVFEVMDFSGAGRNDRVRNNNATYSISPGRLKELIEKHGKKIEPK